MIDGIYLLLGTNLGNRQDNLETAIAHLQSNHIQIIDTSSIYETEAWGYTEQPPFYNQTVHVSTHLSPGDLLEKIKGIERIMGREEKGKWQERLIDIDILYYHSTIVNEPLLKIPHLEIANRMFTLLPLSEIAPDFIHPILKKNQAQLLEECKDPLGVKKIPIIR